MPLKFVFDEDCCSRSLIRAIKNHNSESGAVVIDTAYVGGPDAPPKRTRDHDLVRWAAEHGRIVVSRDRQTLIAAHSRFVSAGNKTSGLVILRRPLSATDVVEWLALLAEENPAFLASAVQFLPL